MSLLLCPPRACFILFRESRRHPRTRYDDCVCVLVFARWPSLGSNSTSRTGRTRSHLRYRCFWSCNRGERVWLVPTGGSIASWKLTPRFTGCTRIGRCRRAIERPFSCPPVYLLIPRPSVWVGNHSREPIRSSHHPPIEWMAD